MKMLCVKCDEAMVFDNAEADNDGSAGLVFACPKCGGSFAMLINPMEAQVVKSLGVQVGGRQAPHKPMEILRNVLVTGDKREKAAGITWSKEAEERLEKVPSFARPMARKSIEKYAAEKGIAVISTEVMDEARKLHGM